VGKKLCFSLYKLLGLSFLILFLADTGKYFFYPDISRLKKENPGKTAFMLNTEESRLRKCNIKEIKQIWVPLSAISSYLVNAVLIAEDDNFWSHNGFDRKGILDALRKDIESGELKAGGSTITQQLARNLYLSPSKSPMRKLKEAIIAYRLERTLPKERLLEIYLNVAEWGDGIFGAEAAARHYYGKPASELAPHEAARLASVLPNPKRYGPYIPEKYVENRSKILYGRMLRKGVLAKKKRRKQLLLIKKRLCSSPKKRNPPCPTEHS
jgi:monofunctional biosynthetic peptidoglycan transglycosylase